MGEQVAGPSCVKVIVDVPLEPPAAFDLFAKRMQSWWPGEVHVQAGDSADVVLETRVGGRWFERTPSGDEGRELQWGEVLAYDPPDRLVLTWQLTPSEGEPASDADGHGMEFAPAMRTEAVVTFVAAGQGGTTVTFTHSKLDALGTGEGPDGIRELLAGDEVGWPYILGHYERVAGGQR